MNAKNLMSAHPIDPDDDGAGFELKGDLVDLLAELLATDSEEDERDVMRRIKDVTNKG